MARLIVVGLIGLILLQVCYTALWNYAEDPKDTPFLMLVIPVEEKVPCSPSSFNQMGPQYDPTCLPDSL